MGEAVGTFGFGVVVWDGILVGVGVLVGVDVLLEVIFAVGAAVGESGICVTVGRP